MTWHQPVCRPCWHREHPHDLPPTVDLCSICDRRILRSWGLWVHAEDLESSEHVAQRRVPEVEHCCMCGGETTDGIHALYRPAAVPYPSED